MINIYPANRLENLVILLDRVMQTGTNVNVLSEEVILVQSKGMQHWLNMKLAQKRGISMNLAFSLPMQFFWHQIRTILGKDEVPEQSSYTREVLSWRIDSLLSSDAIITDPQCREATQYWLTVRDGATVGNADKRYQLACQLADLFEQYQIFRPDWLLKWERGHEAVAGDGWQALIWRLLLAREPLHPISVLQQAMASLADHGGRLPERISLFGINTLPPLWLEFLSELGKHTQVHFFHLNPCVEYWGDIKSEKAYAREQFYRWLKAGDLPRLTLNQDDNANTGLDDNLGSNPLLANLGGQGKDFLYLLQEHTSIEIPVYEAPQTISEQTGEQASVLEKIQTDILKLFDRRTATEIHVDDSLVIASAHSALREIQALHDWLLHQFNKDPELTPKDVLVMCPNVENYAPYVEAVFAHGWSDWSERVPPLPCSIADRTLKDAEPLVQAYIDLLELPDSRFQISQILAYLRLPALQKKFAFSEDDLVQIERWLHHATVHWGLDAVHKQQVLLLPQSNNKFTWQQGLNRLLLGFAQDDQPGLYQDQLLLPDVEGDDALLLGRLFELLELLQLYAWELQTPRAASDWKLFLQQVKESLFSPIAQDSNAQQIIEQAIDDLGEYTSHAGYKQVISLPVIRDFLVSHFNQPEPGRQFMAGQVTFCSMVPMRSVPFRIIAILGLNDGEFPRQRQPMGFDLMAAQPARRGDRSRRGDDRYLFLEALISCREKLYLSYQGHDIKTNNTREPSLVLQELMDYLQQGFGWQLSGPGAEQVSKVSLQAFSKDNFRGPQPGFSDQWLRLSAAGEPRNNLQTLAELEDTDEIVISAEQLVQFFDNPCRSFAQTRLKLYFATDDRQMIEDSEPFVSNHLDRYVIQDAIIKTALNPNSVEQDIEQVVQGFRVGGTLPDTPITEQELMEWQGQACDFSEYIQAFIQKQGQVIDTRPVSLMIDDVRIEAELPYLGEDLFFWRLATPKGRDDMRLWIHHLIAQIISDDSIQQTHGLFRGKDDSILRLTFPAIESPRTLLSQLVQCWKEGMQRPLILHAELAQQHCLGQQSDKPMNDYDFNGYWTGNYNKSGLASDPFVHWFWSDDMPQWQGEWQQRIERIYMPLYDSRQQEQIE